MTVRQLPGAVSPDDGCRTTHEQTRSHPVFQQRRIKGQGVAMMGLPKGGFKVGTPKKPEARASVGPELLFPSCPMLPGFVRDWRCKGARAIRQTAGSARPSPVQDGQLHSTKPAGKGSVGTSGFRSHWHRAKDSVPLLLGLPSLPSISYSDCNL